MSIDKYKDLSRTDLNVTLNDFQDPIMKDLVWLINSPSLLSVDLLTSGNAVVPTQSWFNLQFSSIKQTLLTLDKNTEYLQKFEQSIKPFVGDYFEKLVSLWLHNSPNYHHIQQRVTVFENKITIGEFDFLFIDRLSKSGQHWEVAIKFYLQYFNGQEYEYLGPNAKDTFLKKTHKMLNQQLALSTKKSAIKYLCDYQQPIEPSAILKGFLFYPSTGDWKNPQNIPENASKDHLKGWWTRISPLNIPKTPDSHWVIMQKPFWLTLHMLDVNSFENPMDIDKLKVYLTSHFKRSNKSLLLMEIVSDSKGKWIEVSRGFIVSTQWPVRVDPVSRH